LKEAYQISILAQRQFFPDNNLTHTFLYYDPETRVSLDGKIRIITLELEKSAMYIDKPVSEMSGAELWAVYFEEYARQTTALKNKLDWQAYMVGAKRQGRAEGLEEGLSKGHAEKALEIARKMKNAGRPLNEIMEFTGLPAETIEQ